ncbi:MAG: hypothetical protein K8L99_18350 [Anaerolineae bacterium]|nr:hypothetical protein [Anaerolineae bacterium]
MAEQQGYVFRARNKHTASMGKAPEIDANTPKRYHGYFENEFGEQAIFVYDYTEKTAGLWLGDAGWGSTFNVVDGDAPELELSMNEKLWLKICWHTATSMVAK